MPVSFTNNNILRRLDLFLLLLSVLFILFYSVDKKVWYDETVSILCSKGISHNTPLDFNNKALITNTELSAYNTSGNVFNATVTDNSNSYLYNISLHFFTLLFGNSINIYLLLSRLFGVACLVAFYFLSQKLISSPGFRALALFFLFTDAIFLGMSIEIRAYILGILFICLSALYLFRFIYEEESPGNLFLVLLFSVGALLSHFLSVYILFVYGLILLAKKGKGLFAKRYVVPILLPLLLLAVYFLFSFRGLLIMDKQNAAITEARKSDFSYTGVFFNFIKFTTQNIKILLPAFNPSNVIKLVSAAIFIIILIVAKRVAHEKRQKQLLFVLLGLALSGSIVLTALSLKAGHMTPFYNRYFSFSVPFNCLFIALFLQLLFQNVRSAAIKYGALVFFVVPAAFLFYKNVQQTENLKYSHVQIARIIADKKMTDVEVKDSRDATLIHCFLPGGYNLNYHVNPGATLFKAYNQSATEEIPIVRIDK